MIFKPVHSSSTGHCFLTASTPSLCLRGGRKTHEVSNPLNIYGMFPRGFPISIYLLSTDGKKTGRRAKQFLQGTDKTLGQLGTKGRALAASTTVPEKKATSLKKPKIK